MNKIAAASLSTGAVVAANLVGQRFGPQHPRTALWYASLRKPSYTPPGPVIGVAWTVLDALLCVAGYRLLTARPGPMRTAAVAAWGLDVLGLAGFPWVFFGRKKLGASTAVSGGMLASAAAAVSTAACVDPIAAAAEVPLVAWLGFATLLSEEIWRRN
jgi:translocator protein